MEDTKKIHSGFEYFKDESLTKEYVKELKSVILEKTAYRYSDTIIYMEWRNKLQANKKITKIPSFQSYINWNIELKKGSIDKYIDEGVEENYFILYFQVWVNAWKMWTDHLFTKFEGNNFPDRWKWLIERKFSSDWHLPSKIKIGTDTDSDEGISEIKFIFSGATPITSEIGIEEKN